jgi:hypothetical protein
MDNHYAHLFIALACGMGLGLVTTSDGAVGSPSRSRCGNVVHVRGTIAKSGVIRPNITVRIKAARQRRSVVTRIWLNHRTEVINVTTIPIVA